VTAPQTPASTAPAAAAHPLVQGRCPACNGASLFLGSGGYVTCSRLDCPNPTAADEQLHTHPAAEDALEELRRLLRGATYHRERAETRLDRVTALHEQWVKAGPPPLGTPLARWWDRRLIELHDAIRPPAEETSAGQQTKEQP
jgi:hypothetical protein